MKRKLSVLLSLVVLASVVLAACGAPATEAPAAATEAPAVATEAPAAATEAPAVAYEGSSVVAPDCEYGGEFKSIEAVDELTVKITLCVPDPAFPSKIAFTSFAIQPSEYLEASGGNGDLLEKPVGTGPYIVDSWVRGDQLVLKKNPNYWGENVGAETLVFKWSTESAQRLLELQSGTVDGIDNVGPDDFATVEGDSNLALFNRPALNIMYIGFNNNPKVDGFDNAANPLANEKVRQAIAMGIDRQRIVENFYPAGSEVASHFTPCAIPNGCVGDEWYAFDATAAKALLTEAGYPDGFETVLNYRDVVRGYLPDPNVVAQDLQAQLKENLNITLNIEVMESGAFLAAADAGQLQGLHMLGWGADYPDQTNFLGYHFGAGASQQFGDKFDDITEALTQGAQLASDSEREPFYTTANNAIRTHVPMIPVAHGGSALAFKASVEGAFASPLGNEEFSVMSNGTDTFVWMQNAEPISLYCADETDGESLRACEQVTQSLLAYETGGTAVEPSLAESYEVSADLTEWTFKLRPGVVFHDGSTLDANDVVTSLAIQWDAANPLHTGNTGAFSYWSGLFGSFLNAPPAQ
ncbi:ABC transporter substrate-binding protein [Candidatus Villigracilis saccharophilus]|uniref:ABC transporter substrate-binding protein n=1 Tax=Candidatus Villigracilis saccharophilus TaxID=3140684 RepID=UPI003135928E|nr:peptide ABC transporter substrate-binding protein [Anaerolineales bacterium]